MLTASKYHDSQKNNINQEKTTDVAGDDSGNRGGNDRPTNAVNRQAQCACSADGLQSQGARQFSSLATSQVR